MSGINQTVTWQHQPLAKGPKKPQFGKLLQFIAHADGSVQGVVLQGSKFVCVYLDDMTAVGGM